MSTKKLNTEIFIDRCNNIHKFIYDYSLVDYKNIYEKVKIICKEHGIFEQLPKTHLYGGICPKCANINRKKRKINNTDDFIKLSKETHEDNYDYSLSEYINARTKVEIICKEHGVFEQLPRKHIKGQHCPICTNHNISNTGIFINKSNIIHNNKYSYNKTNYVKTNMNVIITCYNHGDFEQKPYSHLNGSGCPKCNDSKGETQISLLLDKYDIKYFKQFKFEGCKNKRQLPFDFYLPDYNTCIEFDGIQHFEINDYWGGKYNLEKIQNNDNIKNNFCKESNIKLIRIKYNENIEKKLKEI